MDNFNLYRLFQPVTENERSFLLRVGFNVFTMFLSRFLPLSDTLIHAYAKNISTADIVDRDKQGIIPLMMMAIILKLFVDVMERQFQEFYGMTSSHCLQQPCTFDPRGSYAFLGRFIDISFLLTLMPGVNFEEILQINNYNPWDALNQWLRIYINNIMIPTFAQINLIDVGVAADIWHLLWTRVQATSFEEYLAYEREFIQARARADAGEAGEARADAGEARADAGEARADAGEARADAGEARTDAEEARADAEEARADAGEEPDLYVKKELLEPKRAYEILGLSPGASKGKIKKAWAKLMMRWHPDKNPHLRGKQLEHAKEMTQLIQKAYESLKETKGGKKTKKSKTKKSKTKKSKSKKSKSKKSKSKKSKSKKSKSKV